MSYSCSDALPQGKTLSSHDPTVLQSFEIEQLSIHSHNLEDCVEYLLYTNPHASHVWEQLETQSHTEVLAQSVLESVHNPTYTVEGEGTHSTLQLPHHVTR